MDEEAFKKFQGHGIVKIHNIKVPVSGKFNKHTQTMESCKKNAELRRLAMQQRRLVSIKDVCCILHNGKTSDAQHGHNLKEELKHNTAKFLLKSNVNNPKEKEACDVIRQVGKSHAFNVIKLKKISEDYRKTVQRMEEKLIRDSNERDKKGLEGKKAHKRISAMLKGQRPQPLRALQRTKDGKNGARKGIITTNEKEIDEIAREEWASVYDGNVKEIKEAVDGFVSKYAEFIYHGEEYAVGKIDWRDI